MTPPDLLIDAANITCVAYVIVAVKRWVRRKHSTSLGWDAALICAIAVLAWSAIADGDIVMTAFYSALLGCLIGAAVVTIALALDERCER